MLKKSKLLAFQRFFYLFQFVFINCKKMNEMIAKIRQSPRDIKVFFGNQGEATCPLCILHNKKKISKRVCVVNFYLLNFRFGLVIKDKQLNQRINISVNNWNTLQPAFTEILLIVIFSGCDHTNIKFFAGSSTSDDLIDTACDSKVKVVYKGPTLLIQFT